MMQQFGQFSAIGLISHIVFLTITWYALQALRIDVLIRPGREMQAKVLLILLTIAIGSLVSNFFLDYLQWSQNLRFMFG